MSRYNPYAGQSSSWKVSGADDPNGASILQIVEPIILSWVAHCRQSAKISDLPVNFKYLSNKYFSAAWQMLHGQEILNVSVYPQPEVTPEVKEQIGKEPIVESFTPPKPPEVEETPIPTSEIPTHEDKLETPEMKSTYLLVLFDNNKIMAVEMRDLKDLASAKPVVKPKTLTHSDWTLPNSNIFTTIGLTHGYKSDGSHIPVLPNTLQMTNSHEMGPVAIAGISVSEGIISTSELFNVFRIRAGFSDSQPLTSYAHIGNVGFNGGFPALMSTDNIVYACNCRFTISDKKLVLDSADAWGYASVLSAEYGYLGSYAEPFHPNFIDSNLQPHFDGVSDGTYNSPTLGALWFGPPPDTLLHGNLFAPSISQVDGLDVVNADDVSTSYSASDFDVHGSDVVLGYAEYSISFVQEASINLNRVQFDGVAFIVPYSTNNKHNYYVSGGDAELHTQFGQDRSGFKFDPGGGGFLQRAYGWEVFNGFMQVSNGKHNLQGFVIHSTTYDSGSDTWPLNEYFFYLDGVDVTTTLADLCGTTADKIQYAFMDVPQDAVLALK